MVVVEWGKNFASKLDLSAHQNILDIGCRQGYLSAFLAKKYVQQNFIALDNLSSEIEKAQDFRTNNLSFQLGNVLNLPFHEQFDAVVSFNCLLWIQDKLKALQNLYSTLRPGGKAHLQFFVSHHYPKNDRFFIQTAKMLHWKRYFKGFKTDYYEISLFDFCRLLSQVGFVIHHLELAAHPCRLENAEHLHDFAKSWVTYPKYLPKLKQAHFLNEAVTEYCHYHDYSLKNPFTYTEYLLEVVCEKPLTTHFIDKSHYYFQDLVFSKREAQILKHFLLGKSAKEIAGCVDISAKTVEFHLANVKAKVNCHKRSDIFQAALRYGFINLMFDVQL